LEEKNKMRIEMNKIKLIGKLKLEFGFCYLGNKSAKIFMNYLILIKLFYSTILTQLTKIYHQITILSHTNNHSKIQKIRFLEALKIPVKILFL